MTLPIIVAAAAVITYFAYRLLYGTDTPYIKGLPEVPGLPLFGSLFELETKHAKVARGWVQKYGPVFQVRMGNRRIVFVNTFDSVRHFWITNQSALISRPKLHTFHTVVSSSQGFTIGTSPWDESCKNRRKAAATALNRPAVQSYMPLIDLESTVSINELLSDSKGGEIDLDPRAYWQRYALNTSLTLNYGYRIDGDKDDELLKEITDVERGVSNFRSTSNNWQDYVPLLRLWSKQSNEAATFRKRRDVYMDRLLNGLKERIEKGMDKPCITGNIIKDPGAKLNEAELKSIGLTMVSAGLDTVPANLIMGLAYLASPAGRPIQERAHAAITAAYPDAANPAWHACLHEEKIPYVTALYKEILRYWSVIPICLPRVSIKPIEWQGVTVPAGTTFYMNAYAADYDSSHFSDPEKFDPERYLNSDLSVSGTPHYAYGAGSRMCVGSHLANRELFTAFVRLISAFEFTPPKDRRDEPVLDCLEANAIPTSLTMEPKAFKIGFKPRDRGALVRWISESEERTKELR
ncbi:cytochrome P450 phenylacetate hydroxylase-like protein [Bimuria novae-zelandiae CBS 107.79]|uniref:Cytochrome P450 phenylacetate hydroxylase-like protein n=1 Tax=Bimuria novae-zelandiae CBS 107.79 TaxID=1447943 RepID=A0A6A5UVA5_9PLEO|nr:cytochrome P450 phenylacetate hydroxylase-like protein [Bimuria novae-zelandiae CBS 107.79]